MGTLRGRPFFAWEPGSRMRLPARSTHSQVFTKNRGRPLAGNIAQAFFERALAQARQGGLLSDEHVTVDGTLIEAWASLKSFTRKGTRPASPDDPRNPTVNFHGERRSNATHTSTSDPEARLGRKAKGRGTSVATRVNLLRCPALRKP